MGIWISQLGLFFNGHSLCCPGAYTALSILVVCVPFYILIDCCIKIILPALLFSPWQKRTKLNTKVYVCVAVLLLVVVLNHASP